MTDAKRPKSNQRCPECGAAPGIEHAETCRWYPVAAAPAAPAEPPREEVSEPDAREGGLSSSDAVPQVAPQAEGAEAETDSELIVGARKVVAPGSLTSPAPAEPPERPETP